MKNFVYKFENCVTIQYQQTNNKTKETKMTIKEQIYNFVKSNQIVTRKQIIDFYCKLKNCTKKDCNYLALSLERPNYSRNCGYLLRGKFAIKEIAKNQYTIA